MNDFSCGMVSVTFRKRTIAQIADVTADAGLSCVEWGGDVHVPPADSAAAAEALHACEARCLTAASYGSYYRAGVSGGFDKVLESACLLRVPNIRVWAGNRASADADDAFREQVNADMRRCAALAAEKNMTISFEYHGGTLTDSADSALRLIEEIDCPNVRLYWQPNQFRDLEFNTNALRAVLPYVTNVHVFHWEGANRFPLRQGERQWDAYLNLLAASGRLHGLFLEFSPDDTEDAFRHDAETLLSWAKKI